jgi:hypothetical protein
VQNLFWHRSALCCRSEHLPFERRECAFLPHTKTGIQTSALGTGQAKNFTPWNLCISLYNLIVNDTF